jgi:hypothetical protein
VLEFIRTDVSNHSQIVAVVAVPPQDGKTAVIVTRRKESLKLVYQASDSIGVIKSDHFDIPNSLRRARQDIRTPGSGNLPHR